MTDDGEKLFIWDAVNSLIEIKLKFDSSTVATYAYDYQSRRITKTVGATETNFVYDDWNPIAKFSGTTLSKSYTWGMDLSGSMQGAGGVGGLLSVNDGSATYYPIYDGNGNVSEYVDATGAVVAHYEYDAFGQVVASGTKADEFTHQFSTKQLDSESGLHYYGYRYYDSSNGRWPGRDTIEEEGGKNLYGFVGNDGIGRWDVLGNYWSGSLPDGTNYYYERHKRQYKKPNKPNVPGIGAGPQQSNFHYIRVKLKEKVSEDMLDEAYTWLSGFEHFEPNTESNIRATNLGKEFSLKNSFASFGSSMVFGNDTWFGVSIDSDENQRILKATTLDNHPLVGNRWWTVAKISDCEIEFKTWASFRSRNLGNRFTSAVAGESAVKRLWHQYMTNNAEKAIDRWKGTHSGVRSGGTFDVVAEETKEGIGNLRYIYIN